MADCLVGLFFLDFQNRRLTNAEALSVSNHVSNDGALGSAPAFNATATDRSAFRIEVADVPEVDAGPSVKVELRVGSRPALEYTLNRKKGTVYRGDFLRLVTDKFDNAALGKRTVLCSLGDEAQLIYKGNLPANCEKRHTIHVGRPPLENNNDHPDHLKHDIRELRLNVVIFSTTGVRGLDGDIDAIQTDIVVRDPTDVHRQGFLRIGDELISYADIESGGRFTGCVRGVEGTGASSHSDGDFVQFSTTTPAATLAEVNEDLGAVDERFAQSGIRIGSPVNIDFGDTSGDPPTPTGRVLPASMLGGFLRTPNTMMVGNDEEQAIVAFKDPDPNTIDVFYVESIFEQESPSEQLPGTAYPVLKNGTGDTNLQNFVVLSRGRNVFSLAHEIMHILLNDGHRPLEPSTALFHATRDDKLVDSTKRIGPYPEAASSVGDDDTRTMRANAETLPQ